MIRFVSVLALLAAVVSTDAFLPSVHRPNMHQIMSSSANEDTDFDAPVLNNPVKASAPKDLDHDILVVDDECYLGKYGQFNECVDFGEISFCCRQKKSYWYSTWRNFNSVVSFFFHGVAVLSVTYAQQIPCTMSTPKLMRLWSCLISKNWVMIFLVQSRTLLSESYSISTEPFVGDYYSVTLLFFR